MRTSIRCAVVGAVALVLGFGQGGVALAHHTATHPPVVVDRLVAAPATDTPVWTSMVIANNGGMVSFTPPGTTSTPSTPSVGWSCTTSAPALNVFHASCIPASAAPVGQWHCAIPMVQVSVTGTPADTLTGTADCSGVTATCSATPVALGTGFCDDRGLNRAPTPFECTADYRNALASTNWSVRCVTTDP